MNRVPEVPPGVGAAPPDAPRRRSVALLPLMATIYFMVSGGPFGLEDLILSAGYRRTLLILVVTPLVWSLPVAMAVGELSAAYPDDGGYYVWVKRALGPFWGVQEGWWSLAASFFDLAIYPTLFTRYLALLWPPAASPPVSVAIGVGLIAAATAFNLRGAGSTAGATVLLGVALLSPFVALSLFAFTGPVRDAVRADPSTAPWFAGVAVAMWNYMGWDNASTIAGEVSNPGRTYPRALLGAIALVTVSYLIPVAALSHAGLAPASWAAGTWALAADKLGHPALATALAIAGMVSSGGMLLTLVLSYSRLPSVLANDGFLPAWLGKALPRTGAPWKALLACGVAYSACLGLGFRRLVELDVLIYGGSLALEFVALAVLRVKEPETSRPYRVPGGLAGASLLGVMPMGLLVASLALGEHEGEVTLVVGVVLAVLAVGVALYALGRRSSPGVQAALVSGGVDRSLRD